MSFADDLRAEAALLSELTEKRAAHTAAYEAETAAFDRRLKAAGTAKPSDATDPRAPGWRGGSSGGVTPPGPEPPTPPPPPGEGGTGARVGVVNEKSVADFLAHANAASPSGGQNAGDSGGGSYTNDPGRIGDGPGATVMHTTSSFGGGQGFLRAYQHGELVQSEAWVEAHCKLITIKVPNPKARYAELGATGEVDLEVWDCRAAMQNADALFVPKGAWEKIAGNAPAMSSGAGGGGDGVGGGVSTSSAGSGAGSGFARAAGPPSPPLLPGGYVLAPPPTTQAPGGKSMTPTIGEAAIARALADQTRTLERIAAAAERGGSEGLNLRRVGKL